MPAANPAFSPPTYGRHGAPPDPVRVRSRGWRSGSGTCDRATHSRPREAQLVFMGAEVPSVFRGPAAILP